MTAKREQRRLGILMLDMNGLKPINDGLGHRAGDAAIKEVANRITAEARQSDTVARLGGDEFGFVLSTIRDRETALLVVQRIAARIQLPFAFEGRPLPMSASIGLSICPDDGDQPDILLEKVDQSMYVAKRERGVRRG